MPLPAAEGTAVPSILPRSGPPLIFLAYEVRNFITKLRRDRKPSVILIAIWDRSTIVEAFFLPANLVNSNAVRAVRRRGNVTNGRNAGPRYVNANNAPSNGNWNYGSGHYPYSSQISCILSHLFVLLFQGPARDQNTIRLESAW